MFCFDFELDFSAVFIIASGPSSVCILLSCVAGEVCIPGQREEVALEKCQREDCVDSEMVLSGVSGVQQGISGVTQTQAVVLWGGQLHGPFISN